MLIANRLEDIMKRSIVTAIVTAALAIASSAAAAPTETKSLVHVVQLGETLSGLALYYGCSVEELQKLNKIDGESVVQGTRLAVPWPDVRLRSAPRIHVSAHKVLIGENLGTIAAIYSADVRSIRLFNGLTGDRIRAGQTLKIPSAERALKRVIFKTKVKPGDSLRTLAARHDMQQRQVRAYNPTTDWSALRIGQRIAVHRYDPMIPKQPSTAKSPTAKPSTAPIGKPSPPDVASAKPLPLRPIPAPILPKAPANPTTPKAKAPCKCSCHKAPKTAKVETPQDDDFAYKR